MQNIEDQNTDKRRFSISLFIAAMLSALIWMVFIFEKGSYTSFAEFGINPRNLSGLQGIFFAPFIHSNLSHIINNTAALLMMTTALFFFYPRLAFRVLFSGWIITHLLVWLFARPSYHIGASGLLYSMAFFLVVSGIISKNTRLSVLSLLIIFFYGSMVWGVFPQPGEVSWESHLAGALSGMALSVWFKSEYVIRKPEDDEPDEDSEDDTENIPEYFSSYTHHWFENHDPAITNPNDDAREK